jgi:hypothetical protein
MIADRVLTRKNAVLLGVLVVAGVALWLLPVSLAALVPRTPTSWLIVAGIVAIIAVWSRLVVPRLTRNGPLRTTLRLLPVVALLAVVLVPATIDREVSEDLLEGIPPAASTSTAPAGPSGDAGGTPAPPPTPAPAEPERLSAGEIMGVGHVATGQAVVYRSGGTAFVRLEGIDIQGAVDVFVWLVPEPDQTEPDGGVNLGELKGTRGDANYVIPADVDPSAYRTVLLWCRAFTTPIAIATQA